MSRPHSRTWICAALSLAALGSPALCAPARAGSALEEKTSAQLLLESLRAIRVPEPPDAEALVPGLTAALREEPALLLDILANRIVPATADEGRQRLSVAQEDLAHRSLSKLGRSWTLSAIERWRNSGVQSRAAVLGAIGAVGDARDLSGLFTTAMLKSETSPDERLETELERAITRVLQRSPQGFRTLISIWRTIRPELVPALLKGVGETDDPHGLPLLLDIFRGREDLALLIMSQTRVLAPSTRAPINMLLANRLRGFLDHPRNSYVGAACLALGQLQDDRSVPALIDLLDHESHGVRDNAHWALRQLTGLRLPAGGQLWQEWYDLELRWFGLRWPALRRALVARRPETVAVAVRELGTHRLFRHKLVDDLQAVLERPEQYLRMLACRGLSDLDSLEAAPHLVEALDDPAKAVREAAIGALSALTGSEPPDDLDTWRNEFVGGL